ERSATAGRLPHAIKSPAGTRLSTIDQKIISPLQGFVWEVPSRRLRFAPPPVMHITPHAGLRNLTIMRNIRT
ncbi:MAG: hypothetical protein LBK82_03495, partial [Planctomycetaceae bacterium]|nr:hypothetical protein [Planctomycetaceae bacterium]